MSSAFSDLLGRAKAAGKLVPDDIRALRGEVYGAPQVSAQAIEALVALDGALAEPPPADWSEFLAEASVDYLVRQGDAPEDYIDEAKAHWATTVFATVDSAAAMEALTRILETAGGCPQSLQSFALAKARDRLIALGCVGAADAAMLRRLVFAGGGEGDIGVTREEADALFDINDACQDGANDPTWTQLFSQAIADHLTATSPFKPPSAEDAPRDEAWLAGREPPQAFMSQMLRKPDVRGALHEMLHPLADEADEWREPEAQMEAVEAAAAVITDAEARWLIGRLGQGALSPAERRLIETLRAQAPQSALLQPLLGQVASSEPGPAPVFGHRKAAPG